MNTAYDTAIAKWQTCDIALVKMLNEVVSKAEEFMQDDGVKAVATKDVFVDSVGRQVDPAWCWLLDIVVLLAYQTTGEKVEGNTLPLQAMLEAIQSPSRRESSEDLNNFMATYAPSIQ